MARKKEDATCPFCKRGSLIKEDREIAFSQWTDKGYVVCRVTVPTGVCMRRGSKSFTDSAESIAEVAFIGSTKAAVSHAADSPLAHTSPDPHRSQPLSVRSHAPEQDKAWGISMARRKNG